MYSLLDDSAILAAFNDTTATDAAILEAIDTYAASLFSDGNDVLFNELPDGAGRQKAIALGLKEVARLFGGYETVEEIKAELAHQITVEYAKYQFIIAIDNAADAAEMADAIYNYGGPLYEHRMDLIAEWEAISGNEAVAARVAVLKADPFTTVLSEIALHVDNADYMADLCARLLEARGTMTGGKFFGDGKIMAALDEATDDIILDAFNDDDATDLDILAAIDAYEDQLLSGEALAHFRELPDDAGRQKAIALGLKEVATLFGDYISLEKLQEELAHQINVEYAKFQFINAIDNATDVLEMAEAIEDYVELLSDERQALIADWEKVVGNEAVAARVAVLKADDYTKVLKQIVTRLGQSPNFAMDLADLIIEARSASTGGKFFGVVNIVAALKDASTAINYAPTVEAVRNVTTNEDVALVGVDIGAVDEDGDTLTYAIKDGEGPAKGVVTLNDGKFTYTPTANVHGTDSFTIVVSDGKGGIVEQTVNVTINSVNDAPTAPALSPATVSENAANGTVVGDLSSTDVDTAALTYSLVNDAGGRFAVQGNKLVVKNGLLLDYEQATSHQVTVRVFDGTTNVDKILTVSLTDIANETVTVAAGNNVLFGGEGKDKIVGGTGADRLGGGIGNDTLTGGKGKDVFVFNSKLDAKITNRDTITDFNSKDDSIWLDDAIFKKLGKGTELKPTKLAKKYFSIDGAKDKNDYINFNSKTGAISYDADGLGGKKGIEFAKVKVGSKVTADDFFIV
ncbi:MAG: Ig-like domain-containing protein [Microvirga sp.]